MRLAELWHTHDSVHHDRRRSSQPQYSDQFEDGAPEPWEPYVPPTPPEPPLTVALIVGGPGTPAHRLDAFSAAAGMAQVCLIPLRSAVGPTRLHRCCKTINVVLLVVTRATPHPAWLCTLLAWQNLI